MKFEFLRDSLANTLDFIKAAIPRKEVAEPVLNSFHFKGMENNRVQIMATDYDLMSVAMCDCISCEIGEFTIPADKLLNLIGMLSGENIAFDVEGASIFITCGTYKAEFKTLGCENYPSVFEITNTSAMLSFNREAILNGFRRIDFAVNSDEAKKNLMAVQVSKDGMVASNGSVTALYRENFDVDTFCISSSCLSDLISVMAASSVENVEIFEEDAYLVFKFGENVFFTRKTNVVFPDVFNKIDAPTKEKNTQVLRFKVRDLAAVLKRIALTAPDDTRVVKFELATADAMKVSARDSKDFFSEEMVPYTSEGFDLMSSDPVKIYFNYALILDVLSKMISEDIEFKFDFSNIRMPVRVDEDKTTVFLMRSAPPNGEG